jgi:hypothetical protein
LNTNNIISCDAPSQEKSFFSLPSRPTLRRGYATRAAVVPVEAVVDYPHLNQLRGTVDAGNEKYPEPLVVSSEWPGARAVINTNFDFRAVAVRDYFFKDFAACARGFVEALRQCRRGGLRLRSLLLISDNDFLGYGIRDMGELSKQLKAGGFIHCWRGDDDAVHTLDVLRDTDYADLHAMYDDNPREASGRLLDAVYDAVNLIASRVRVRKGN